MKAVTLLLILTLSPMASPALQRRTSPALTRPCVFEDAVELSLPASIRAVALPYVSAYGGSSFLGAALDLNRDGSDDYMIQGPREGCGTGGCSYSILDGATAKRIGHAGGNAILIHAEPDKGFPKIETISRGGAESGTHEVYAFNGNTYVRGAKKALSGPTYWGIIREWKKYPRCPST